MILPDVNVLISAFRTDSTHHALCRSWLQSTVNGDAAFGISPLTLAAVVRITTNARIYRQPSTLAEAFAFSDYLLGQPDCRIVEPGPRHWELFRALCSAGNVTGADVSDAWYAAVAIEANCTWITLDRGFARFSGLTWTLPAG
jgi:toxin-antitoxin system PIN domain toxin